MESTNTLIVKQPRLWPAIFLAPLWATVFPLLTIGLPALVLGLAGYTDRLDWQSEWREFAVFLVVAYVFAFTITITYGMSCYGYLERTQRLSRSSVLLFGALGGLITAASLLSIDERTELFLIRPVLNLFDSVGQLRGMKAGVWDSPSELESLAIQMFGVILVGFIGLLMATSAWKMIERHDY